MSNVIVLPTQEHTYVEPFSGFHPRRVNSTLTPKWSTKLAAFAVCIWDQCYAMKQSLRID